jgi:hypothetical protein
MKALYGRIGDYVYVKYSINLDVALIITALLAGQVLLAALEA